MPIDLLADILSRARQLILPLVASDDEREALLTEAFYLYDPLLYRIKREGAPKIFAVMCVKTLLDHGCLSDGEHALARLLSTVRYDCGIDKHPEIDDLVRITNSLCVETKPPAPSPLIPPMIPAPPSAPIQTLATRPQDRWATVFISYSHRDTEFAQRLIAALNAAGHACWIDTSEIKGGDEWIMTIAEGINNSYAFVPIVTRKALESRWVQDEIIWARQKNKLIIPAIVEDVFGETRFFPLVSFQGVTFFGRPEAEAAVQLLSYLPRPMLPLIESAATDRDASEGDLPEESSPPITMTAPRSIPRTLELDYLERLRLEELLSSEKYTALGGVSQGQRRAEMRAVFELMSLTKQRDEAHEVKRFEDAVSEIRHLGRAVLLGEPGGGKTTTLWKLAADLVTDALNDRAAPIPLLIRLGKWTDEAQPLDAFIQTQIGGLGEYLAILLSEKRAALLLDGLNELPVGQRDSKYPQVQRFIQQNPAVLSVVSVPLMK